MSHAAANKTEKSEKLNCVLTFFLVAGCRTVFQRSLQICRFKTPSHCSIPRIGPIRDRTLKTVIRCSPTQTAPLLFPCEAVSSPFIFIFFSRAWPLVVGGPEATVSLPRLQMGRGVYCCCPLQPDESSAFPYSFLPFAS